jgi:hypothetical protein
MMSESTLISGVTGKFELYRKPVRRLAIWIRVLATPTRISSVGPSISSVMFDIKDFDIECPFDIDVLHLRMSISKVFDIEGIIMRYRRSQTFDIEGHEQGCRYGCFISLILNIERSISYVDIVNDIEGP